MRRGGRGPAGHAVDVERGCPAPLPRRVSGAVSIGHRHRQVDEVRVHAVERVVDEVERRRTRCACWPSPCWLEDEGEVLVLARSAGGVGGDGRVRSSSMSPAAGWGARLSGRMSFSRHSRMIPAVGLSGLVGLVRRSACARTMPQSPPPAPDGFPAAPCRSAMSQRARQPGVSMRTPEDALSRWRTRRARWTPRARRRLLVRTPRRGRRRTPGCRRRMSRRGRRPAALGAAHLFDEPLRGGGRAGPADEQVEVVRMWEPGDAAPRPLADCGERLDRAWAARSRAAQHGRVRSSGSTRRRCARRGLRRRSSGRSGSWRAARA